MADYHTILQWVRETKKPLPDNMQIWVQQQIVRGKSVRHSPTCNRDFSGTCMKTSLDIRIFAKFLINQFCTTCRKYFSTTSVVSERRPLVIGSGRAAPCAEMVCTVSKPDSGALKFRVVKPDQVRRSTVEQQCNAVFAH